MEIAPLGTGFGQAHAVVYATRPDVDEVVVFGRTPEKLATIAVSVRFATTTDLAAVLSDASVDLVGVCLPTRLHADVAVRAMQAGRDVLIELPLAATPADAHRGAHGTTSDGEPGGLLSRPFAEFLRRHGPPLAPFRLASTPAAMDERTGYRAGSRLPSPSAEVAPMVSSRTAMMDLRRVVGGLLTRNAVLSTLLINYADRLDQGHLRRGVATAPCFIVPTWGVDQFPPLRSTLLTVEAHASPTDPGLHEDLDAILRLLHVVLTDDHAGTLITARRVEASADLRVTGLDTVVRVGTWDIAPIPPSSLGAAQRRLLPWPDCRTSIIDTGAPAPGTTRVN